MEDWILDLKSNNVGEILEKERLSKHTSWKIGGPADAFVFPKDKQGLIKAVQILNNNNIPWKVLGKGSNLLALDGGYRGAILSLDQGYFKEVDIDGLHLRAGASVSFIRLANLAAKNGFTGLEFAGGIPGTVGGAIYMNAGAHGSDISKVLQEAEVLLENGELVTWSVADFRFAYRTSRLQTEKGIVLSGVFKLNLGERRKIAEDMAGFKDRRRKTQPYNYPTSGSVFRNPEGDYAGRLIEELGLKGYQIGGAQISTQHANFIVNVGDATAEDIIQLIHFIKEKVYHTYKIELVPEVEMIGER